MKPFLTLSSIPTPIPRTDIDTDLIIPADYLKTTTSQGLGNHLFERVRRSQDPDFLEIERRNGSQVLIARHNFGCGSSREHAVWALMDFGYRAILAPEFANIFAHNALNNGLLLIKLSDAEIESILHEAFLNSSQSLKIDLPLQKVSFGEKDFFFEIDPYQKNCLIQGMTDFDYLLSQKLVIDDFFEKRKSIYQWVHLENL